MYLTVSVRVIHGQRGLACNYHAKDQLKRMFILPTGSSTFVTSTFVTSPVSHLYSAYL
jgi:hypothetical protein